MERAGRAAVASFFSAEPMAPGLPVTLGEDAAHHVRVLRLAVGERVSVRDGAGKVAAGVLVRVARQQAVVDVEAVEETSPLPEVHLLVPVADRERMLWLAEKCCELGVASWRPVLWRRSRSVSPRGEGPGFQSKVRARMISALLQSRGAWLPHLHPDASVERAIAAAPPGARLLLDAEGAPALASTPGAPVTIAVGPEGGIEPDERQRFVEAGFRPTSLGPTILRFETAGVAAAAIARAALAAAGGEPARVAVPDTTFEEPSHG